MSAGWIDEDNLEAFCLIVSGIVGYDFDSDDWNSIRFGVRDTHTDKGRWYEYSFIGDSEISLHLGHDEPGSGILMVEWQTSLDLDDKVQLVVEIAQEWKMSPG
jgi:hypothetical protein